MHGVIHKSLLNGLKQAHKLWAMALNYNYSQIFRYTINNLIGRKLGINYYKAFSSKLNTNRFFNVFICGDDFKTTQQQWCSGHGYNEVTIFNIL